MKALIRVCSSVLLASSRAFEAVATRGLSCSCSAIKSSSVFASAGISLPVVGEIFLGTSTLILSRNLANLGVQ
jgi:hypothetical protein